jgi:ParB family transcriptional regulator, chromosome partitioning protein
VSKRALGKGLDALIAQGPDSGKPGGVLELPVGEIDPSADQPRKNFEMQPLQELADSIKEKGIIQPIVVERQGQRYQIVAGERRFRAAKMAGLDKVPALVRHYSPDERLQISLIENIQRENLNPIEEAAAYSALLKQTGMRQEELAQQVGKSRSAVANSLRLLKLPPEYRDALSDGALSPGHGRAVLSVVNPADRDILFKRIVEDGISVREAEVLADRLNKGSRGARSTQAKPERKLSPDVLGVEQRLIESLGTKVKLNGSLAKGRIEISYFSKEDLERLFDLLAGE